MKKEEFRKQPWFDAVKAGARDLIRDAGGIDRVAEFLGCSTSLVGNWNNHDCNDIMPTWAMLALEADLGKAVLSKAYARQVGATVVNPATNCRQVRSLATDTAALMMEASEVLATHADAFADGEYSVTELRELRGKFVDVETQAGRGVATIDRKLAERAK